MKKEQPRIKRPTFVMVHTTFYHRHCWKKAPAEVEFLKQPHPHMFKVQVVVRVTDNDRQVEYYMLHDDLRKITNDYFEGESSTRSCEEMATIIGELLQKEYPTLEYVSVNEDQGFGSIVEFKDG